MVLRSARPLEAWEAGWGALPAQQSSQMWGQLGGWRGCWLCPAMAGPHPGQGEAVPSLQGHMQSGVFRWEGAQ